MKINLAIDIVYIFLCLFGIWFIKFKNITLSDTHTVTALIITLIIGLAIRCYFACQLSSFWEDVRLFRAWADATAVYGLKNYYTVYRAESFMDYPPGYIYVLAFTQKLRTILGVEYNSIRFNFLLKLIPALSDLAATVLVYVISKEKLPNALALGIASIYCMCPAIIYNSCVWGQIDGYFTFFILLALYFASRRRTIPAAVVYAFALMTKAQALFFGPVFLFYVLETKDLKEFIKAVLSGILSLYMLALPFSQSIIPLWLINLYTGTISQYTAFTSSAYNIYYALGLNNVDTTLYPFAKYLNIVVIFVAFIFSAWGFSKQSGKEKYYFASLVLIVFIFNGCIMMHERYLLPAVAFALVTYAYTQEIQHLILFLMLSAVTHLNMVTVLREWYYEYTAPDIIPLGISICCIITFLMTTIFYTIYTANQSKDKQRF